MNKHIFNSIVTVMMPLGMSGQAVQAYGSYQHRNYLQQGKSVFASNQQTSDPEVDSNLLSLNVSRQRFSSNGMTQTGFSNKDTELVIVQHKSENPEFLRASNDLQIIVKDPVSALVLIDGAVPDKHMFYRDLKPGTDVVEINANKNGLRQLETILTNYTNLDSLHIVSHASDGTLYLGNSQVTESSLEGQLSVLSTMDNALKEGADVLFYGCDLAKTEKGEALLELIANQADVDVAASNNLTGTALNNADWELEIRKGDIDTQPAFDSIAMANFDSVLAYTGTIGLNGFAYGYSSSLHYIAGAYTLNITSNTNNLYDFFVYNDFVYLGLGAEGQTITTLSFSNSETFDLTGLFLLNLDSSTVVIRITSNKGGTLDTASLEWEDSTTLTHSDFSGAAWDGITSITIQYDDGSPLFAVIIDDLVVAGVAPGNSLPVFANLDGDSYTYTEGDSQTSIDQGTALALTDADGGDFNGGNLTVTITSGEDAAEDIVSLSTLGTVSLAGTTAGSNVSVGGATVGTLANNIAAGNDLVVDFTTTDATLANIQTLARAITYENTDTDNPTTGARNVRVTVNDGDGGTSTNQDVTVTVAGSNDVPTLTNLNGDSFTYSQGDSATVMDVSGDAVLADVDSLDDFNSGNLTVTITSGEDAAEDKLSVNGTVTLGGMTAASNLTVDGFVIGTLGNNIAAGNDFVVNFNADATPARVQTLIRGVTYENTDVATATTGARNVRLTVNDGDGGTSANQDVTITVTSPDSDGSLTGAAIVTEPVNLSWTVDTVGEAVNLFDFTLSDGGTADGLPMVVSQVVVNVTGSASDTDRAKVTWRLDSNAPNNDVNNITGTYNAGADTITFITPSLSIADGTSEILTINGYYNDNTGLTHNDTIILSVDGDTDLTLNSSNTQMGVTSAVNNSSGTVVTDNIDPVVTSVGVPGNATYTLGSNLDFTVNFSENVTVDSGGGNPRVSLTVGATTRYASYLSGSSSTALTFRYVVQAGDEDLNGLAIGAVLDTNSGTIRDPAGNDLNTTLNSVGSLASVFVDARAPVVAEVTPVSTPTIDSTPDVTFSTTEAGVLAVAGSCGSGDEGAVGSGNQTITLTQSDNATALTSGTYSNCTLTVTDAAGNASSPLTLTSFVIDASAPTVVTNAGKGLDEGDTGVGIANTNLSSSDNISAAANVTYTLVNAPANGTLKNGGGALAGGGTFTQANLDANAITYDHDGSETLSDTFTFTVTDGAGNVNDNGAANFTFNFTIATVNDAPSTTVDANSTNEDNTVIVDVLANDSDVDGTLSAASVTVTVAPSNGGTSVNVGTGAITYTPNANFAGVDTFSYTVADNNALASSNTAVTITVNAQNDAPVAAADTASTPVNTLVAIDVANNDTDIDTGDNPDPTTIVVVGGASNGAAVFNGATNRVDYTPNGGFSGIDSFTYTIDDGTGATSNAATVTVTVIAPNVAPTANNDTAIVAENSSVNINVLSNDSDSDGSLVVTSVTVQSQPTNGTTIVNANGRITYTPNNDFNGSDSFTYRVSDNNSAISNTATVNITVNAVNQAPVAGEQLTSTNEDVALPIVLTATDADDDTLTYVVVGQPTNGVLTGTAPNLTYTPNEDYVGSDSFSFKANDGTVDSNVATVNITVNAVNQAPVAGEQLASTNEDVALSVVLTATDADGDALTYAVVGQPTNGVLTGTAPNLTYTPNEDFVGSDSFSFKANDGTVDSNVATINITVNAVNQAPVAGEQLTSTNEDVALSVVLTATDADDDTLTYVVVGQPTNGVLTGTAPNLTYTPNEDYVGSDSFSFKANDGTVDSNVATINITVNAVNQAPVAGEQLTSTNEDVALPIVLTATDADDDTLTYVVVGQPTNGVLTGTAPNLTYTPNEDYVGSDSFSFKANDGTVDSNVATINITVNAVNQAPVAGEQLISTNEDVALPIVLTATDADDDTLTYVVVGQPTNGVLTGTAPNLTYTPNEGYVGNDDFSFIANDGTDDSNIALVDLSIVEKANIPPIALGDEVTIFAGEAINIQVLANDTDSDGDTLSVVSVSTPLIGNASAMDDMSIMYQSEASFIGDIVVKYGISDGKGGNATAKVLIHVIGSNDAELPIIMLPEDINTNASGVLTQVDLGIATAVDQNGIPIAVTLMRDNNFFKSGRHQVYWEAIDANGIKAIATQIVNVRPQVYFSADKTVAEGSVVKVLVRLNGDSPEYPLEINFSLSGTATSNDHDLANTSIVIESGQVGQIQFTVLVDDESEPDEQLQIDLDPSLNAVNNAHVTTITENNVAASIILNAKQNEITRIFHTKESGNITFESQIIDTNIEDNHSYDWSSSDSELIDNDDNDATFTFAPDLLATGTYSVNLLVTDNGIPALKSESRLFIEIVDNLPTLTNKDSDDDGVPDIDEGYGDTDGDGIPNYLDDIDGCHVLIAQMGSANFLIEGDIGGCLSLGKIALGAILGGARVENDDLHSNSIPADNHMSNTGGIFDFVAYQLPVVGQNYNIVIPQLQVIPANAIYRKFDVNRGWFNFVEDENNQIASAPGNEGHCPAPGSAAFEQGLIEGYWCVRLTIEDGGPNDIDNTANGTIVDPGGVAVFTSSNSSPVVIDDEVVAGKNETISIEPLINDTDADNDALTLVNASVLHGTITIEGNNIIYTSPVNYLGNDAINYVVTDGNGGSADGEVIILISNRVPVAVNDAASTTEDASVTIDVITNDTDGDNDELSIVSAVASFGSVMINNQQMVVYTPNSGFIGDDIIEYTITDGVGGIANARVNVQVTAKVMPPKPKGGAINTPILMLILLIAMTRLPIKLRFKT